MVAQEELALIEERLAVADEHLAADESAEAATARDVEQLQKQLSSARLALVDARQRLSRQEQRLGNCTAGEVRCLRSSHVKTQAALSPPAVLSTSSARPLLHPPPAGRAGGAGGVPGQRGVTEAAGEGRVRARAGPH